MQYEHRRDTNTSNKLEVGVVRHFDYALALTEMASICHVKRTPGLPCVRGRGIRWRFGRQIRYWAGTPPSVGKSIIPHSPFPIRISPAIIAYSSLGLWRLRCCNKGWKVRVHQLHP